MRHFSSPILIGMVAAGGLAAAATLITASEIDPRASSISDHGSKNARSSVVDSQSTLSSLGIDFGAAELLRYAELDLSDGQKQQALGVVRELRPTIDRLCGRMTRALKMDESTPASQQEKQGELQLVVSEFKQVQAQIMSGLHAIVTPEQEAKLQTIKQRERQRENALAEAGQAS